MLDPISEAKLRDTHDQVLARKGVSVMNRAARRRWAKTNHVAVPTREDVVSLIESRPLPTYWWVKRAWHWIRERIHVWRQQRAINKRKP
jgi:hypothetical protein